MNTFTKDDINKDDFHVTRRGREKQLATNFGFGSRRKSRSCADIAKAADDMHIGNFGFSAPSTPIKRTIIKRADVRKPFRL